MNVHLFSSTLSSRKSSEAIGIAPTSSFPHSLDRMGLLSQFLIYMGLCYIYEKLYVFQTEQKKAKWQKNKINSFSLLHVIKIFHL